MGILNTEPSSKLTVMSTGPSSPGGVTTRILSVDAMVTVGDCLRPNRTSASVFPGRNPPPRMEISSPPAVVPRVGSTEITRGGPSEISDFVGVGVGVAQATQGGGGEGGVAGGIGARAHEATIAPTTAMHSMP